MFSILLPLEGALATAIKNGSRFVSGADLDLHEKSALAATPRSAVGALHGRGVGVLEGLAPTEHVVYLLPLQVHLAFELPLDAINVRAGAAEEPHIVAGLLSEQNVGARRAE